MHGIKLYRANFFRCLFRPRLRSTEVAVQLIVPLRDRFVRPQLFDGLSRWAPNVTRRDADAGHWQLLARPQKMADWMRQFTHQVENDFHSAQSRR